jgi:hypothetical protein
VRVVGGIGALLWVVTKLLRNTSIAQNEIAGFLLGVAPNFAVGLMIPALVITNYPVIFKKDITFKAYIIGLFGSYVLLFMSEIINEIFLNSRIDFYDMIASLVGFVIMTLLHKHSLLAR